MGIMRLKFLNRKKEIRRLRRAVELEEAVFMVVYGRRRCGKSTLLQEIVRSHDMYYLADRREASLQIQSLAVEIARQIPGFNEVDYPSWQALLQTLNVRSKPGVCLLLDEFPYLVQVSPELPSLVQKFIDDRNTVINLIICGSSQRMMQGLVLDAAAPLYGRATEILKVRPLEPFWIQEALAVRGIQAVEAYAVWGGVPRYWELAKDFGDQEEAIKELILDRDGVLHNEPERLLLDDMRSAMQAQSLLSLIANGCHRLSELASRLGKPAGHLTRPLSHLIDLGYIRRELPYGESVKSTRRSLYKLNDPFLMFWYRYVQANRSLLERDLLDEVYAELQKTFSLYVAAVWEDLARASTDKLDLAGMKWSPAQRWWGRGRDGKNMEVDIVSESLDGQSILFGEAKWEMRTNFKRVIDKLNYCAHNFPHTNGRKVVLAYWLKEFDKGVSATEIVLRPEEVITALR
jgi:AAA+ ATPase superfamily predicted ATPase